MRPRFHSKNYLFNIHALAVPMFKKHAAFSFFDLVFDVLDWLCPTWSSKLITIASDSSSVMIGRIDGVVIEQENESSRPVHSVCCILHLIDWVAKACLNLMFDEKFIVILKKTSNSPTRKETLFREMGKTVSKWPRTGSWWENELSSKFNTTISWIRSFVLKELISSSQKSGFGLFCLLLLDYLNTSIHLLCSYRVVISWWQNSKMRFIDG